MTDELAKHASWSAGFDVDEAMSAARRRRLRWLAAHWLLRPIGYLELTVVYKIEFTTLPPLFEIPGYTIEHATADDIRELTRHSHRGEPPAVINSLWTEGHHCFVAKSGKRIVAYNWIAFGAVQEEEYRYEPDSKHAICVDAQQGRLAAEIRGSFRHSKEGSRPSFHSCNIDGNIEWSRRVFSPFSGAACY
jgi:hypothetical protein